MTTFSQARFSEVDANIKASQVTAPADTTTAQAIQAFGNVGGQIRQGLLARDLKGELRESGNIIGTINAGEGAIQDAVRQGQIDPTTEKFQRLAAASEQGKISHQRAALEAEVLLRRSISMAPGFADQLRQTARDTLGFDPTAGALNSLFLSGPDDKSGRVTQEMKDLEEADQLVSTGYASNREQGLRMVVGARAAQLQDSMDAHRIKQGSVNAGRVVVMGANRANRAGNSVMLEAMTQIRNTGGIQDVEVLKNQLVALRERTKSDLENEMASSEDYLYQNESYNNMRTRIDEVFDSFDQMIDNEDHVKMLSRQQDLLESVIRIEGINLAPDLAIMATFGDHAVANYLELMAASRDGDPRILEELTMISPQYRFLSRLSVDAKELSPAIKAAAEKALGRAVESGEVTQGAAEAAAKFDAIGVVSGKTPKWDVGRIIQNASDVGMSVTSLSTAAQTAGSHENSDPEARETVVTNFRNEHNRQAQLIAPALQQSGFQLGWDGDRFIVQDPEDRNIARVSPLTGISPTLRNMGAGPGGTRRVENARAEQAGIMERVDFLNDTMAELMKGRGWAKEMGLTDVNAWATMFKDTVNQGAIVETPFTPGRNDNFQSGQIDRTEQPQAQPEPTSTFASAAIDATGLNELDAETLRREGFSPRVYPDPAGIDTVGYGRNIEDNPITPEEFEKMGVDPSTPMSELELTDEQAQILLQSDVARITPQMARVVPTYSELPIMRQKALMDMAINLGVDGLGGFTLMREAIAAGDFEEAANQIENSAAGRGWVRQKDRKDWIRNPDGSIKIHGGLVSRYKMNAERMRRG